MRDTLNRRIRFAPPQPLGVIELHERDIALFEVIHRHGPLPSRYLFAFSELKNLNTLQHRLTKLYNEGYLTRPREYFDSFHARYQPLVYDLAPKAEEVLFSRGTL